MTRASVVLASVVLGAGCGASVAGPSPVVEPAPPAFVVRSYDGGPDVHAAEREARRRWAELTSCAGFSAPLEGSTFVLDPFQLTPEGAAAVDMNGELTGGFYLHASRELHVVGSLEWSASWKHEQLHYLLDVTGGAGNVNHANPLFASCTR